MTRRCKYPRRSNVNVAFSLQALGTTFSTAQPGSASPPAVPAPLGSAKYAIVTGALGGIGSETVLTLKSRGYTVVGLDMRDPSASNPDVCDHFFKVDISFFVLPTPDPATVSTLNDVKSLLHGSLHLLVNNAAHQVVSNFESLSCSDWRTTMDTNVHAPFALSQLFLPELKSARGSIVNVASIHANLTKPGFVAYASSKGALVSLTKR